MKADLVVFDVAGTTVYDDDAVNMCLKRALASRGFEVSRDDINAVMGEPKPVAIAKLLMKVRGGETSVRDNDVRDIHERFQIQMLAHYRHGLDVRPVEGAVEVFGALRAKGISVALDTGFSRVVLDTILTRLEWADSHLIDATVASDEVDRGRPFPDLITRAMSLTGVSDPACVAKIGDTPADLLSGAAAACGWVIGITSGSHRRAELEPYPHTHLLDRLIDLPDLLSSRLNT